MFESINVDIDRKEKIHVNSRQMINSFLFFFFGLVVVALVCICLFSLSCCQHFFSLFFSLSFFCRQTNKTYQTGKKRTLHKNWFVFTLTGEVRSCRSFAAARSRCLRREVLCERSSLWRCCRCPRRDDSGLRRWCDRFERSDFFRCDDVS